MTSDTGLPTRATTQGAVNRVVVAALRSPAGPLLGRRLAVLEYEGRRSGRRHRLVTAYTTVGSTVRIRVGRAQGKTWWRNFRSAHALRLRLRGVEHDATAHLERGGDGTYVVADLAPGRRGTAAPAGGSR